MANIPVEYLTYFKDLLEGRAEVSWNAWIAKHDAALRELMPRAAYLRLKFQKLDEAEKLLVANGVSYEVSPLAKRERYYADLHPDVCDELGRPTEEFLRSAYDGAIGDYMDGHLEKTIEYFQAYVAKIRRMRSRVKQDEELGSLYVDGQTEFTLGDKVLGRIMLEPIAALEPFCDQVDASIFYARELLATDNPA